MIGIDQGSRTLGLALSDPGRQIASPLQTIGRRRFRDDFKVLDGLLGRHNVCAIVIGLPLHMDGSAGRRAQSVRDFAANLSRLCPLPICFWDERLSTAAASRVLIEADRTRARRRQLVDKLAASFILQGFLDWLHNGAVAPAERSGLPESSPPPDHLWQRGQK